jgi:hypothetical protein
LYSFPIWKMPSQKAKSGISHLPEANLCPFFYFLSFAKLDCTVFQSEKCHRKRPNPD